MKTSFWIKAMNFGKRLGCHQIPERSFFVMGCQFPVCARCTGVFAGEVLFILLALFGISPPLIPCLLLLIPMGIDWGIQRIGLVMSNNIRRFITGFLGGFGITKIYFILFSTVFHFIAGFFR